MKLWHHFCFYKRRRTIFFPLPVRKIYKERKHLEMKVLKQILFAAAVMICFSMTASAQSQNDKRNPPDKKNPPVIVVEPKKPKDSDKPKENDRPKDDKKKPESAYLKSSNENEIEIV